MTSSFIFFCLICEFLWFLLGLLDLSSKDDIRLDGLCEIEVPYLDLRKETSNNGVVSFGGRSTVDGS